MAMGYGGKQPRVLMPDEQERFFDAFDHRYWTPTRDYLLCRLMYEAGLRVSEACNLKREHVVWQKARVVVRDGKGGRDRVVYISDNLRDQIRQWEQGLPDDCPWMFPTRKGKPVQPTQIRRTVKRMAKRADLREVEEVSPHSLRHTFAHDYWKQTGDVEAVRKALGHTSLAVTREYLNMFDVEHEESMRGFVNSRAGDL